MKQRNIYENVETEPAVDMSSYLDMEAIIDARLQRLDYENFNNKYNNINDLVSQLLLIVNDSEKELLNNFSKLLGG